MSDHIEHLDSITLHHSGIWRVQVGMQVHWTEFRSVAELWVLAGRGVVPADEPEAAERLLSSVARHTVTLN